MYYVFLYDTYKTPEILEQKKFAVLIKQIIRLSIVLCMNIYTYQIEFILQWPVENNSTMSYSDK